MYARVKSPLGAKSTCTRYEKEDIPHKCSMSSFLSYHQYVYPTIRLAQYGVR